MVVICQRIGDVCNLTLSLPSQAWQYYHIVVIDIDVVYVVVGVAIGIGGGGVGNLDILLPLRKVIGINNLSVTVALTFVDARMVATAWQEQVTVEIHA